MEQQHQTRARNASTTPRQGRAAYDLPSTVAAGGSEARSARPRYSAPAEPHSPERSASAYDPPGHDEVPDMGTGMNGYTAPWWGAWPAYTAPYSAPYPHDPTVSGQIRDSEARMTRALTDLRLEVAEMRRGSVPAERIIEHWQQDGAILNKHETEIQAIQSIVATVQATLTNIPTKLDLADALKAAMTPQQTREIAETAIKAHVKDEGYVKLTELEAILSRRQRVRWNEVQKYALLVLGVLTFLYTTGLIHPLSLFTGK